MIKARCEICGQIYLGERCRCQETNQRRSILCICGQPAQEIFVDDLGEWPMCNTCLKRLPEAAAIMNHKQQADEGIQAVKKGKKYPFGLTARKYEIARLSHLSDEEIAQKLCISPATVRGHLKVVFKKLGVRSRYEIRHVLHAEENHSGCEMTKASRFDDLSNEGEHSAGMDEDAGAGRSGEGSRIERPTFFLSISTNRLVHIQKLLETLKDR